MKSLQQQLRESEQNYNFHKSRSEWNDADVWAKTYQRIRQQMREDRTPMTKLESAVLKDIAKELRMLAKQVSKIEEREYIAGNVLDWKQDLKHIISKMDMLKTVSSQEVIK